MSIISSQNKENKNSTMEYLYKFLIRFICNKRARFITIRNNNSSSLQNRKTYTIIKCEKKIIKTNNKIKKKFIRGETFGREEFYFKNSLAILYHM